jgi:AbrB family looped-hinge helix DNA binding protein
MMVKTDIQNMGVTVSSKGQISLPSALRRTLGIQQGDRLLLELQPDGAILMRRQEAGDFRALIGMWRKEGDQPLDVDAYIEEIRGPVEP